MSGTLAAPLSPVVQDFEEFYEVALFIPISQIGKLSLERAGYLPEVAHGPEPEPKAEEGLPTG